LVFVFFPSTDKHVARKYRLMGTTQVTRFIVRLSFEHNINNVYVGNNR